LSGREVKRRSYKHQFRNSIVGENLVRYELLERWILEEDAGAFLHVFDHVRNCHP
jgi:hypothetical protein